jgi:hypothetical protein
MAVSALGTLTVAALPHDGPAAMVGVVVATQAIAFALGGIVVRLPARPTGGRAGRLTEGLITLHHGHRVLRSSLRERLRMRKVGKRP